MAWNQNIGHPSRSGRSIFLQQLHLIPERFNNRPIQCRLSPPFAGKQKGSDNSGQNSSGSATEHYKIPNLCKKYFVQHEESLI